MAQSGHAILASILPAPKNQVVDKTLLDEDDDEAPSVPAPVVKEMQSRRVVPSYPHRKGFVPMKADDFCDGGAYPEIHIIQYPLNMGKPGQKSTAVIPVQVTETGSLRTDLIVKQGVNSTKIVQSTMADVKEKKVRKEALAMPDEDEVAAAADKTRRALEALTNGKIKSSKPTAVTTTATDADANYIRYTPNPNAPGYNPAAAQRVIKMVEAQVDPMEPPKHKHMKVPRAPAAPPVPVLHSPPRKLTVEDQQAWKIPPCVSNWVNARGFVIPLDKRLAADGRGLQETTINNKFATLAESLYIAERKAVQDLNVRNELRKKIALREKEERELSLREMANRARMERSGHSSALPDYRSDDDDEGAGQDQRRGGHAASDDEESVASADYGNETEEDKAARQQRERIRMERRKERERELRLANMKGNLRKSKADRDGDRDISEKMALGMLKGTGKLEGETAFDNRLFNQSAGMDAGFGGEDDYNVYSRPLFDRGGAGSVYRPKNTDGEAYGDSEELMAKLTDTSRFRADKGFKGADAGGRGAGPRDAPVQFEKAEQRDPYARDRERDRDGRDRDDDAGRGRERDQSPPRRSKRARTDSDDE